jgi:hypothetical protein
MSTKYKKNKKYILNTKNERRHIIATINSIYGNEDKVVSDSELENFEWKYINIKRENDESSK